MSSAPTSVDLDNLRLFARVAELKSFTAAARVLGVPKQTLSRRIAELEAALDVQLLHRTTRALHLTQVGSAYAERCREIVRLMEDATRAVTDAKQVPSGLLRVTADPLFGETFLKDVLVEYMSKCPNVDLDVVLTQRRIELIEEGFDVAIRIGHVDHTALTATRLGPARVRYCASPKYVERKGTPLTPDDLTSHECIVMPVEGTTPRWPFRGDNGPALVPISGKLRVNAFGIAHTAAVAGLGIAMMPEYFCEGDIARGALVPVLDEFLPDAGSVWIVHPTRRYLVARVRAFVDLVVARLGTEQPWVRRPAPKSKRRVADE